MKIIKQSLQHFPDEAGKFPASQDSPWFGAQSALLQHEPPTVLKPTQVFFEQFELRQSVLNLHNDLGPEELKTLENLTIILKKIK